MPTLSIEAAADALYRALRDASPHALVSRREDGTVFIAGTIDLVTVVTRLANPTASPEATGNRQPDQWW